MVSIAVLNLTGLKVMMFDLSLLLGLMLAELSLLALMNMSLKLRLADELLSQRLALNLRLCLSLAEEGLLRLTDEGLRLPEENLCLRLLDEERSLWLGLMLAEEDLNLRLPEEDLCLSLADEDLNLRLMKMQSLELSGPLE